VHSLSPGIGRLQMQSRVASSLNAAMNGAGLGVILVAACLLTFWFWMPH
jgi:hypothetical protein